MVKEPEYKLWYRQENEPSRAFNAFILYRDMLPKERSLERVRQKMAKGLLYLSHLKRWSSRHQWVKRVMAYDDYLAEVKAQAQEKAIGEMAERQAKEGMALQTLGLRRFVNDDGTLKAEVIATIKDKDALRAIEIGAGLERSARGDAPPLIDMRTQIVNIVSPEVIERIDKYISRLIEIEEDGYKKLKGK